MTALVDAPIVRGAPQTTKGQLRFYLVHRDRTRLAPAEVDEIVDACGEFELARGIRPGESPDGSGR